MRALLIAPACLMLIGCGESPVEPSGDEVPIVEHSPPSESPVVPESNEQKDKEPEKAAAPPLSAESVEDLRDRWGAIPVGQPVAINGRISNLSLQRMPGAGFQLQGGIKLGNFYDIAITCNMADHTDIDGLRVGQTVTVEGKKHRLLISLSDCHVSETNPPEDYLPEPFSVAAVETRLKSRSRLPRPPADAEYLTPPNGISVAGEAMTADGLIVDEVIGLLQNNTDLVRLEVTAAPTQPLIAQIAQIPHLQQLTFNYLSIFPSLEVDLNFQGVDLSPLASLRSLTHLKINGVRNLSDLHCQQLTTLPCLQHLHVEINSLDASTDYPTAEGISALSALPGLTTLRIGAGLPSNLSLTDSAFEKFSDHPNLAELHLTCDGLSGEVLKHLTSCPACARVTIICKSLDLDTVRKAAEEPWESLRKLDLRKSNLAKHESEILTAFGLIPDAK